MKKTKEFMKIFYLIVWMKKLSHMIYVWFISIWQIFHVVFSVVLKLQLYTDCIKSNKHLYAENVYCKYGVSCCTHIRSLINFVIWKCFSGIVCMLVFLQSSFQMISNYTLIKRHLLNLFSLSVFRSDYHIFKTWKSIQEMLCLTFLMNYF